MVRELDVSRITLRLREKTDTKGEAKDDRILAKVVGNTLDLLKRGLVSVDWDKLRFRTDILQYNTMPLILKGEDGLESRVHVQLKYLPIRMQLDPSESINNMGFLRVDVLDAVDLPAADGNGLSDPYCRFFLNDKQIHKTDVQKKTLHPAWNECFEVPVSSRTAAKFRVECWDWDLGDRDDHLGSALLDLTILEPFAPKEVVTGLDGKSGTIRMKMLFKPDYVTRAKQGSSTFHGTFATPGSVVGAPVKGVGKGVTLVGGKVIKGASFIGRGFTRKKDVAVEERAVHTTTETPPRIVVGAIAEGPYQSRPAPAPASTSSYLSYTPRVISDTQRPSTPSDIGQLSYSKDSPASVMARGTSQGPEVGTAIVSLLSCAGFEGSNIRIYVRQNTPKGPKDVHKSRSMKISKGGEGVWDEHVETFRVACMSDTQFSIQVKDTRTFGADSDLGEGMLSVADAASALGAATGAGTRKVVRCGQGSVTLRTSFTHADQATLQGGSPAGHVRKSFMPGRSPRDRNEE